MELKPGHKQTEVGMVPEDWDAQPLNGLVSITHGFAFLSTYFASNGAYRLTTPGHFYERGGFRHIGEKQKFYTGQVPSDYVLEPGDLIVAMTEQADGLLGSAAFIPAADTYLHNQRLGRVRTLSSRINSAYLFWVFNSTSYRTSVRETAAGTKVKHTSPEKLLEIPVRLPPTFEQRAIAAALSDVDALIGGLDQLIAKKRDIKQATIQQLLTGKQRLPGFNAEWKKGRVIDLADVDPENLNGSTNPEYRFNYIALEDVERGALKHYSQQLFRTAPSRARRVLRQGDILVSTVRPNLQSHLLIRHRVRDFVCSTGFAVVRCKPHLADPHYVYYHLFSGGVSRQIDALLTGSNYPAINSGDVRGLEIPWPPLAEQSAIASVLSDMDSEITVLEQKRDKTRDLKQGMMQELLTGRIRLV